MTPYTSVNLRDKLAKFSEHWSPRIEPRGVVNTGDAGGGLAAANDVWV